MTSNTKSEKTLRIWINIGKNSNSLYNSSQYTSLVQISWRGSNKIASTNRWACLKRYVEFVFLRLCCLWHSNHSAQNWRNDCKKCGVEYRARSNTRNKRRPNSYTLMCFECIYLNSSQVVLQLTIQWACQLNARPARRAFLLSERRMISFAWECDAFVLYNKSKNNIVFIQFGIVLPSNLFRPILVHLGCIANRFSVATVQSISNTSNSSETIRIGKRYFV